MAASTLPRPPLLLGAAALFLLLAVSSAAATKARPNQMTIWEELEWNGLPRGLIPQSVVNYTLDQDTRRFEVYFDATCEVQFNNLIQYEPKITGSLNFGSITELQGVHAYTYFFWSDVHAIEADFGNETLEFEIGYIIQTYPESDFQSIPTCIPSLRNAFLQQLK